VRQQNPECAPRGGPARCPRPPERLLAAFPSCRSSSHRGSRAAPQRITQPRLGAHLPCRATLADQMAATAPVLPQRPLQRPLARSCPPRATHRCCATAPRRGAAGPAGGPQQQQHQQPHPGPPAPRAVATTRDDILLSADERLTLQLRALPTVSADSLAAAKAAAAAHVGGAAATTTAAAAPKSAPQQPQQQQPELPTTPPGSGPFAALRARLPALSGRVKGLILLNAMTLMMGSNWVVVKANADAPNGLDSMEFMALRFLLAATLFVPFLKRDGEVAKAGLQIGFWFAGGYIAQVPGGPEGGASLWRRTRLGRGKMRVLKSPRARAAARPSHRRGPPLPPPRPRPAPPCRPSRSRKPRRRARRCCRRSPCSRCP
jgi:hypothetical protein